MYKLIDLARNKLTIEHDTEFEALLNAFSRAKDLTLLAHQQQIHLSVTDSKGKQLFDLKISQRGEKP